MTRLSGALALLHSRPAGAVVVIRAGIAERAHVAALLCEAFREAGSLHVAEIHRAATEAERALCAQAGWAPAVEWRHIKDALAIRSRIVALGADAVPVGIAVARRLLEDAPDACADLDRAVRDAARAHGHEVTEEHEAMAAEVLS